MTNDSYLKQIHKEASEEAINLLDRLRDVMKSEVQIRRDLAAEDQFDPEDDPYYHNPDDESVDDSPDTELQFLLEATEEKTEAALELISSRDFSSLLRVVDDLEKISDEFSVNVGILIELLGDCISRLAIREVEPVYACEESSIIFPKLILPVTNFLIEKVRANINYIYELTSRQFEEMIAELFFRNGFKVELTKTTRDGGKDIIAISNTFDAPIKYIIECKRYASHRKVSLEYVQRLLGVKIAENANKAMLVTTSHFTNDAIAFAKRHFWDLSLKDLGDISTWLRS